MSAVLFFFFAGLLGQWVSAEAESERVRLSAWTQTGFELDRTWLHQFGFAACRGWMFRGVTG